MCCLCGGGVRFDALCTNSSPYMMWQCPCLLFQRKEKECGKWDSRSDLCSAEDAVQGSEKAGVQKSMLLDDGSLCAWYIRGFLKTECPSCS